MKKDIFVYFVWIIRIYQIFVVVDKASLVDRDSAFLRITDAGSDLPQQD